MRVLEGMEKTAKRSQVLSVCQVPGGILALCLCGLVIPHTRWVREVFGEVKHLLKTTQQPKPVGLPPTLDTGLEGRAL